MHIKVPDTYPYSAAQLKADNPDVSFPMGTLPDRLLADYGVYPVAPTDLPPYDLRTHRVVELLPVEQDNKWVQVWDLIPLTPEEQAAQEAEYADNVRAERNAKLAACDWTQLPDAPVDSGAWAEYRQSLRDVTSQAGFPWEIVWPEQP